MAHVDTRTHVFGRRAGEAERNLSWLESTTVADLSADGRRLLLRENSEREGRPQRRLPARHGRRASGAPRRRLRGAALARREVGPRAARKPGGGAAHRPRHAALARHGARLARRRPLDAGRPSRSCSRAACRAAARASTPCSLEGGAPPRPIGDEFDPRYEPSPWHAPAASPSRPMAASPPSASPPAVCASFPWTGRRPATLPGAGTDERPIQWAPDGSQLYVLDATEIPARVFVVDARADGASSCTRSKPATRPACTPSRTSP